MRSWQLKTPLQLDLPSKTLHLVHKSANILVHFFHQIIYIIYWIVSTGFHGTILRFRQQVSIQHNTHCVTSNSHPEAVHVGQEVLCFIAKSDHQHECEVSPYHQINGPAPTTVTLTALSLAGVFWGLV
jgi:hypothetical protein